MTYPNLSLQLKIFALNVKLFLVNVSKANEKNLRLSYRFSKVVISQNLDNSRIVISSKHLVYLGDIINSFQFFFDAVVPELIENWKTVDYSGPKYHKVNNFSDFEILFPSFAEPIQTTLQYMDIVNLQPNQTALDLGAYSGLSSILFKKKVGASGVVVAVEIDEENLSALRTNVKNFMEKTGMAIIVLERAVWNHNNGIEFSKEGNLGSSASEIIPRRSRSNSLVRTITLSQIAKKLNLSDIDFIKVDIEGAEAFIFDDVEFFSIYHPKILIETHSVGGQSSSKKVKSDLEKLGYKISEIEQNGVNLPLLYCEPISSAESRVV